MENPVLPVRSPTEVRPAGRGVGEGPVGRALSGLFRGPPTASDVPPLIGPSTFSRAPDPRPWEKKVRQPVPPACDPRSVGGVTGVGTRTGRTQGRRRVEGPCAPVFRPGRSGGESGVSPATPGRARSGAASPGSRRAGCEWLLEDAHREPRVRRRVEGDRVRLELDIAPVQALPRRGEPVPAPRPSMRRGAGGRGMVAAALQCRRAGRRPLSPKLLSLAAPRSIRRPLHPPP